MTLLSLLITLAIAGFIVWIITQIPMPATFRNVLVGIAILAMVIYVLQQFGLDTGLPLKKLK